MAVFITCSDSGVVPTMFTGARPGELFELRVAGNIVPRPRDTCRRRAADRTHDARGTFRPAAASPCERHAVAL
ncbi:carbonic anhydrase [Streptomyces noursei]|uniref:carbonic anhydrase n=1 Tax=Streptomyces noursei TaxID=1971 RepID=UPI001CA4D75B|nr:carbonic anhydrase [Streptomyces noursei]